MGLLFDIHLHTERYSRCSSIDPAKLIEHVVLEARRESVLAKGPDPTHGEDESEDGADEQPSPEESEEELMTSEEIQRLMDRLREIEEQARAVQAMLRRRAHVPVEKDW